MTKEQLQKELGQYEQREKDKNEEIRSWQKKDNFIRTEFAKAFGWTKNSYSNTSEYLEPTWHEIFTHVGKLLADRKLQDLQENFAMLAENVSELHRKVAEMNKE